MQKLPAPAGLPQLGQNFGRTADEAVAAGATVPAVMALFLASSSALRDASSHVMELIVTLVSYPAEETFCLIVSSISLLCAMICSVGIHCEASLAKPSASPRRTAVFIPVF